MTLTPAIIDALVETVGSDRVSVDYDTREKLARDRYELSPILREELPLTVPDVVVWPSSTEDVVRLLRLAYENDISVTPRGVGTGNYGQAVAFERGIMIDFSRMRKVLEVGEGYLRAQPGARIFQLEREARKLGQELALVPSTVGSTIGGFLAGGSGGAGSIENGWIWNGFVREIEVVPCVENPEPFVVSGDDARPYLHSYGSTGLITQAEVSLIPIKERIGIYATFPTIEAAADAGHVIMNGDIKPRLLSIDSRAIAEILAESNENISPDGVSFRLLIDREAEDFARAPIQEHGGAVGAVEKDSDAVMLSTAFNHVTERVLDVIDGYCHLQVSGPGITRAKSALDGAIEGLHCHLDGFNLNGEPAFVGIFFHPFTSNDDVERSKELLAGVDVSVNDPHKWGIQRNVELYVPVAYERDPKGLLNPGKLPR